MVQRKVAYYIDGKEEKHGNWMRWINCARVCDQFVFLSSFIYFFKILYDHVKNTCLQSYRMLVNIGFIVHAKPCVYNDFKTDMFTSDILSRSKMSRT